MKAKLARGQQNRVNRLWTVNFYIQRLCDVWSKNPGRTGKHYTRGRREGVLEWCNHYFVGEGGVGPYVKSSTIFLVPAQAGRMAGSQKESKSKKSHWGPALPESLKNETNWLPFFGLQYRFQFISVDFHWTPRDFLWIPARGVPKVQWRQCRSKKIDKGKYGTICFVLSSHTSDQSGGVARLPDLKA